MMPGGMPSMSFSGGHAAGGTAGGASTRTSGDWVVNLAGSGPSMQVGGGSGMLVLAAVALGVLGVVWLLKRK
jgi:hypothetical protein